MDFYYRYGSVETTVRWNRPSWDVLYEWWDEMKTVEGVSDYDFHVIGGALYDIENTWDFDIGITGTMKDLNQLGYIIHHARDLAINKYHIYVDPYWYSSIDFHFMDISTEKRSYIRGTLPGDEIKVADGEEKINRVIPGQTMGTEHNDYPINFQIATYPQPKHLKKPEYNNVPLVKLEM